MVIRNHEAKIVGTLHAARPLTLNPIVFELVALLIVFQFCKVVGSDACLFEDDPLQVFNLLKYNKLNWSKGVLLIEDAYHPLNSFTSWLV